MPKRRIAGIVAGLFAVVVIAAGLLWVFPILKVSNYEIIGVEQTPQESVVEATGVDEGDNLVRVDATAAASGVVELPWVRAATVSRSWPSTLRVEVTEREALLFIEESDGSYLIDAKGTPFIIGVPPEGAIEVTGVSLDNPDDLSSVASVVDTLPESVRSQVSRVDVPGSFDITFYLWDGRIVYWGADENNQNKAIAMETVLTREGQDWNISNPTMVTVR